MSEVQMQALTPRIVALGGGELLSVVGEDVLVKLTGQETGGAFVLFEILTPPGGGPPPHQHAHEDETFVLLEGDYEFLVGTETQRTSAGEIVFGPRNVPHTYKNIGSKPSRMYVLCTPSGFEEFFRKVDRTFGRGEPDVPKLVEIGAEFGLAFLL